MKLSAYVLFLMRKALNSSLGKAEIIIEKNIEKQLIWDEIDSQLLLEDLGIKPNYVARYLKMKYKPKWLDENTCIFENVSCIQKAQIKDGLLYIDFKNSEPHKLPTDIKHVEYLFLSKGIRDVFIRVETMKIIPQEILLYKAYLPAVSPSREIREYIEKELKKYHNLYEISKIKKRSIKRKYLRPYIVREQMTFKQMRTIMNIKDFSEENIKEVVDSLKIKE